MYYTVIKHSGHLRTLEKCRKHEPAARVFYISLVFSNARRVLSQCNTRLRLLYLLIITRHAVDSCNNFSFSDEELPLTIAKTSSKPSSLSASCSWGSSSFSCCTLVASALLHFLDASSSLSPFKVRAEKNMLDALSRIDLSVNVGWCVPPYWKTNYPCFGVINKVPRTPLAFLRRAPGIQRKIWNQTSWEASNCQRGKITKRGGSDKGLWRRVTLKTSGSLYFYCGNLTLLNLVYATFLCSTSPPTRHYSFFRN